MMGFHIKKKLTQLSILQAHLRSTNQFIFFFGLFALNTILFLEFISLFKNTVKYIHYISLSHEAIVRYNKCYVVAKEEKESCNKWKIEARIREKELQKKKGILKVFILFREIYFCMEFHETLRKEGNWENFMHAVVLSKKM